MKFNESTHHIFTPCARTCWATIFYIYYIYTLGSYISKHLSRALLSSVLIHMNGCYARSYPPKFLLDNYYVILTLQSILTTATYISINDDGDDFECCSSYFTYNNIINLVVDGGNGWHLSICKRE